MNDSSWWNEPVDRVLERLATRCGGLTEEEAEDRRSNRPNALFRAAHDSDWLLLISQLRSPITLLLIGTALLSLLLHDHTDAVAILVIVLVSVLLGFCQERTAARIVAKLLERIRSETRVLRSGMAITIASDQVVAGDIIELSAGSSIPADCRLLESKDLHLDEAALTGETFPVEKQPGIAATDAPISARTNSVFLGTHVVSGTGRAVAAVTGSATEFGKVSERLRLRAPETEFERGIRRFGYALIELTLLFLVCIFAINVFLKKPTVESLLFALALAVGLTPQLLPAIVTVNLTRGARRMAKEDVIVRSLAVIENFGSLDVLCCDKTGTLTEGVIHVQAAVNAQGNDSDRVRQLPYWNALYQTGLGNPIDEAIRSTPPLSLPDSQKLDEIPYDFVRRRLSVLIETTESRLLITKGAVANVLDVCCRVATETGEIPIDDLRGELERRSEQYCQAGCRTLGVAYRGVGNGRTATREDEAGMTFVGFLVLQDPPKPDSAQMVADLRERGVRLKMVTGVNRWVATEIARQVGLSTETVLTGAHLRQISEQALVQLAPSVDVFAEVEPIQKERIILALKRAGHVTGYLGDGINDATALHSADVGISVDSAVDVAKEAADIILMRRELSVLVDGIESGRQTFANTLKYIYMATSANFGNMFSMAGASLFLPYLPLLPHQILMANLLTDFPAMAIASDSVDVEELAVPRRWTIRSICTFMIVFGLLSSVFDYVTFVVLLRWLHADVMEFRTGWFIESVCSATLIVLVIRTRRPFFRSRPGILLLTVSLIVGVGSLMLPWMPFTKWLGFVLLPVSFASSLVLIVLSYMAAAELTKRSYYSRIAQKTVIRETASPA